MTSPTLDTSLPSSDPADISAYMHALGERAKTAAFALAKADTQRKNHALQAIADALQAAQADILAANARDVANAQATGLDAALLDRLTLTKSRFAAMLHGLYDVIALPDPIGTITDLQFRPSGIQLGKMRVPLGVVGMIYESRPNVTIEAASLALKSGNAIILRGGSEAFYSNQALATCVQQGLQAAGLPSDAVQVVATTDRAAVGVLVTLTDFVDVIVPRGGKGLIERVSCEARVPVIKHLDGNCHTFIDRFADIDMATNICVNAKTQRYGTCNTMETLLIDTAIAEHALPVVAQAIVAADDAMQLHVCPESLTLLQPLPALQGHLTPATDSDWDAEFLAPILAVKVVADLDAAITHINRHGSAHSDAIITEHYAHALRFLREIDSSSVMINASTRFADGFEYGLGAEIGISTDKIHARGPVGLEGLTSQKWIVFGHGEVRA